VEKLVIDPKVRYGKLDNGLTYYIRHNELPKERAEFYIVQNVGSMQEDDNQRGLAHFLEHMAFNGSKNFPSKAGIRNYTEGIGMKFGENLNAYTGFDETVYTLMNVPVAGAGVIDSCLLILHDWSSFLLLDDEMIEKERGIIREEWRTRSSAQMRIWEQQLPVLFPDSKYGVRLPIGDITLINTFKGDALRAYYKKWYRPDLQGIIIVGDIDAEKVEAKVKKIFADLPKPVNPAERLKYGVPDNDKPLVSIAKDKEMTNITLQIYYKHDVVPDLLKGTVADLMMNFSRSMIGQIMSERFSDIVQKSNPPFVAAWAGDDEYIVSKTKDAWTSGAVVKEGGLEKAMKALVAETQRVKKFGFTAAEYERAKSNLLKSYESAYKEKDKQQNSSFAQEYIGHFTNGDYIPGIEIEYKLMQEVAANFPLEGLNHFVQQLFNESSNEKNVVITLTGPDKAGLKYPTEKELLAMFNAACQAKVDSKAEEKIDRPLIPNLPPKGKIVSEKDEALFGGVTVFKLSNGVKVVMKKTDYKDDQILMTATSPGGLTLFKDDKDIWNKKVINNAAVVGGLGSFSATDVSKRLAGHNVSLSAGIGDENENLNGYASPSDLKTLFELIYLQMTALRTDDEAYKSFEERIISQLENRKLNPMSALGDTITSLAYNNNPRNKPIEADDFKKVDYHRMMQMYKERYSDASDFVFTFVGNITKEQLRPLLEQYLATLPALNRIEKGDPAQLTPIAKGKRECSFKRKLETPKSSVLLLYSGTMPFSLREMLTGQLLSNILDLIYLDKVREDESATYGVQASVSLYDFPEGRTTVQIYFDTDPDKKDKVLNIVKTELENLANTPPREDYLKKTALAILKGRSEIMQENDYWLKTIDTYYSKNFDTHTKYDETLKSITADEIMQFVKKFLEQGNRIEVIMNPE
jgi:zinc protease